MKLKNSKVKIPAREKKASKGIDTPTFIPPGKTDDDCVRISKAALEEAWKLIHTREWPIAMMTELAAVKIAFHEAVYGKAPNENQGTNKA